jgi:hypothetical protein
MAEISELLQQIQLSVDSIATQQQITTQRLDIIETKVDLQAVTHPKTPVTGQLNSDSFSLGQSPRGNRRDSGLGASRPSGPQPGSAQVQGSNGFSLLQAGSTAFPVPPQARRDPLVLQQEFQSIKQKLSSVSLNPDYRLTPSSKGVKGKDQPVSNVLSSSARYTEVNLKLLSKLQHLEFENPMVNETLADLLVVNIAHIQWIVKRYGQLFIKGHLGPTTGALLEVLDNNPSMFPESTVRNAQTAAQLAALQPQQDVRADSQNRRPYNRFPTWQNSRPQGRGRGFPPRDAFSNLQRPVPVARTAPIQERQDNE